MELQNKYIFYIGTARGAINSTECKIDDQFKYYLLEKSSEITSLEWGRSEDEIIVGKRDGIVQLYNTTQNKYIKTINVKEGQGAVVGTANINDVIAIAQYSGHISLWSKSNTDYLLLNLPDKGTLNCMVHNKSRYGIVGTGGESNDFKLWDTETKQCIFKAKSLGHDELNLPIPTSIRGICCIDQLNCCVTKEGHVLLYDDRAQRRPVIKFQEPKASYTTVTYTFKEKQCIAGTTKGYMKLIDLKAPGKCLKTYKGFTGSVTSIICDPTATYVASTSLDRHFRVHNINTKELLHKEYMKQNLTTVLLKPILKDEIKDEIESQKDEDEEYEIMFENMEQVTENLQKSKKRKIVEKEKLAKKKKKTIKV